MYLLLYRYLLVLMIFLVPGPVLSQQVSRIEADFSIKEKNTSGSSSLTMGTVFFDKNQQKIVYRINFPEQQIFVVDNSYTYIIKENRLLKKSFTPMMLQFSIFNLALNGDLEYYGLKQTAYQLTRSEMVDTMLVTIWEPPDKIKPTNGKMILSQHNKKITGIISHNSMGEIIGKQFFKDYFFQNGFAFPQKTIQIGYDSDNKEEYKITTYENIKINSTRNESWYYYIIPGN